MAKLQQSYGKVMAKLQQSNGKITEKLWQSYGKITAKLRQRSRKIMKNFKLNFGTVYGYHAQTTTATTKQSNSCKQLHF